MNITEKIRKVSSEVDMTYAQLKFMKALDLVKFRKGNKQRKKLRKKMSALLRNLEALQIMDV